jgi:hypothetical protein
MEKSEFYIVWLFLNSASFRKGYEGFDLKVCNIQTGLQPWQFHLLHYLFSLQIIKLQKYRTEKNFSGKVKRKRSLFVMSL